LGGTTYIRDSTASCFEQPVIRMEVAPYLGVARYSGLVKDKKITMLPSMQEMAAVHATFAGLSMLNVIGKSNVGTFY